MSGQSRHRLVALGHDKHNVILVSPPGWPAISEEFSKEESESSKASSASARWDGLGFTTRWVFMFAKEIESHDPLG